MRRRQHVRRLHVALASIALGLVTATASFIPARTLTTSFRASSHPTPWGTYYHTVGTTTVADSTNQTVVFRGAATPGLVYGFGNAYPGKLNTDYYAPTADNLRQMKAWGLNVVRVPFEWGRLVQGVTPPIPAVPTLDSTYLGYMDDVINIATANQLYVILDMHDWDLYWHAAGYGADAMAPIDNSPDYQTLFVRTWSALATKYAHNTTVLGYELMNEPNPDTGGDTHWAATAQSGIDAIRAIDTQHLLFVDGRQYSSAGTWKEKNGTGTFVTDRVSPPRIVYVSHAYFNKDNNEAGYHCSHSDTASCDKAAADDGTHYVDTMISDALSWAKINNVPMWLGEGGVPNRDDWAQVLSYAFTKYYDANGWGNLYWPYCDQADDATNLTTNSPIAAVLQNHPGGATDGGVTPTPTPTHHSRPSVVATATMLPTPTRTSTPAPTPTPTPTHYTYTFPWYDDRANNSVIVMINRTQHVVNLDLTIAGRSWYGNTLQPGQRADAAFPLVDPGQLVIHADGRLNVREHIYKDGKETVIVPVESHS